MGYNPSNFKGDNLPVEQVTWYDAIEFCNKLSEKEGLQKVYTITGRTPATGYPISNATVTMNNNANGYRFPTEAEWEFAANGGGNVRSTTAYSGSNSVDAVAWYSENSGKKTHPVGTKAPSNLGLYDMSGNVWEWCWDWYGSYSNGAQTDPRGVSSGVGRVLRGGGWGNSAQHVRSASRFNGTPSNRYSGIGFRVVRSN